MCLIVLVCALALAVVCWFVFLTFFSDSLLIVCVITAFKCLKRNTGLESVGSRGPLQSSLTIEKSFRATVQRKISFTPSVQC